MAEGGDFCFLNIDAKQCKTTSMNKTIGLPEGDQTIFSARFRFAERCQPPSGLLPFSAGFSLRPSTALPLQHIT